jgi:DNA-binding transcriptional LysR family regulator
MTQWNIDIRAARHVAALAKHSSFTRASEELGITQSALSRSIQRFEGAINVRLFDRNRGGVHITAIGKTIVDRARALIREADQFERTLQQSADGLQDSVTLGIGHLPAKALLPQVMALEMTENPDLHVRVMVRSSETLLSLLFRDEIEFAICADRAVPEEAPVRRSRIGTFTMGQLVRPGHPLLDATLGRQPHEFPWIITRMVGDQPTAEDYRLSHLREKPQLEIEDLDCLAAITQSSDVIWVTAQASASRELQSGRLCQLPALPAQFGNSIRMMMFSREDRSLSPAALRLRDRFRIAAKALG